MNSFGTHFRVSVIGESHGEFVGVIIDGCKPGIALSMNDFEEDLFRRRGGIQKATTPRKEADIPIFATGMFNGYTTGAPLTILFNNTDVRSKDYENQKSIPRPGHADWVAQKKYKGFQDYRGGGHFSGRLTVALVAAGVVAKKHLKALQAKNPIEISASVINVAGENNIERGIQKAIDAKDSVGGIVECKAFNIPAGMGEPFFDSFESLISHAVFAIPAIRGIEFGAGFQCLKMFGSEHNDAIMDESGKTKTNHAGGIVGGISNGNDIVFRVAVKPTSSTPKPQTSLNIASNSLETFSYKGRHDLCIALRVPVVLESVTAIVMVDLIKRMC